MLYPRRLCERTRFVDGEIEESRFIGNEFTVSDAAVLPLCYAAAHIGVCVC